MLIEIKLSIFHLSCFVFFEECMKKSLTNLQEEKTNDSITYQDELLYNSIFELPQLENQSKDKFAEWLCVKSVQITDAKYCFIYLFNSSSRTFELFRNFSEEKKFDFNIPLPNTLNQYLLKRADQENCDPVIINDLQLLLEQEEIVLVEDVLFNNLLFIKFNKGKEGFGYLVLSGKENDFNEYDVKRIRVLLNNVWNLYSNKLTLDMVKEVHEREKLTLDAIPDMIFLVDIDGNYLDYFSSGSEITTSPTDHIIGSSINDIFETTLANRFIENIRLTIESKANYEFEYSIDAGNQKKYYEARFIPYHNHTVFILSRDISKRKTTEIALLESENKYKSIVEVTSEWIWEIDIEKKYVYVSQKVEDILGYDPSELIGKKPSEIIYKGRNNDSESLAEIMNFRKPIIGFEHRYYNKTGQIVYIETNAIPIFDNSNHFVGYRGADKDITIKKAFEQQLIQSEESYRTLTEQLPVGIYKTDLMGKIIYANETICKMLGYSGVEELKSVNAEDTFVNPAIRVDFIEQLNKSRKSLSYESQLLTKDGNIIWVRDTCNGVKNEYGELIYVQGILEDITNEKKAKEELMFSENKYRSIFDAAPDATLLVDQENSRIIDANTTACKLYLYSLNEFMKMRLIDFSADSDSFGVSLKSGLWLVPIKFHKKKNGDIFPVEISSSYHIQRGRKIATVMIRDISQRIATEQALFESEERFRSAFEKASIGMAILSLKGYFITVKQSFICYARIYRRRAKG